MIQEIQRFLKETLQDILFFIIYGIIFFLLTENPEYYNHNIYKLILKDTQGSVEQKIIMRWVVLIYTWT